MTSTTSAAESYAARTISNVAWLGGTQFIRQFLSIGTTLVLARFLSPTDYGIFAMTLFVNELAQLFIDFGIGSALVQRKEVSSTLLSTCFWINLAFGATAALVVVVTGPFAAHYFKQPMVAQLLLVSALNLALSALAVLPQAVLSRRLDFSHIALGTTLGSLVGATATIGLAAGGAGIWALVLQPLIGTAVNLLYLLWRAHWQPTFEFDLASVTGVLRFSGQVLISNVANHVTRNLQQLIVAPVIGAASMGLLAMATTVAWLPVAQFTSAAVRAIYPVFARMQDSRGRVEAALKRTFEVVSLLAFPTLLGLAILAGDLLPVVFGKQWAAAAPLVSVLCALCLVHSISFLSGSALLANGRAGTTMRISLLSLPVVAAALWLARDSTVFIVTLSLSASHMLISLLTLHYSLKSMDSGWNMLVHALGRSTVCSLLMGLVMGLCMVQMSGVAPAWRLWSLIVIGGVSYAVFSWFLNRRGLNELFGLVRRRPA